MRIQTKETYRPMIYQCPWLLTIGKMSEILWCICCNSKTAKPWIFHMQNEDGPVIICQIVMYLSLILNLKLKLFHISSNSKCINNEVIYNL